jgi:activator of HSP90 ATPase
MSRIRQEVTFAAPVARLYQAIANSADHAAWSGQPASIGAGAGDAWSAFEGKIHGVNVEITNNTRIVQAWRTGGWAEGTFSLVTFEFEANGDGTKLTMTHDAIPEGEEVHLETGWHKMYWTPITKWLAS